MLANVFFRDVFATLNGGIKPQVLASATTTSGNVLALGGVAPIGKMLFRLLCSASTTASSVSVQMLLYTGTVSSTMASFAAGIVSSVLPASSTTGMFVLELDTRNEYFCNLNASVSGGGVAYVQPVVIVGTTTGVAAALDVLGWETGTDPAKNYDATGAVTVAVTVVETDLY